MKKVVCLVLMLMMAFAALSAALTEETAAPQASAEAAQEETKETAEEPAEEEESESVLKSIFGSLAEKHWYTWAIVAALVVLAVVFFACNKQNWTARRLSYAAMCISISFVLSCIKLLRMPQGGSITPAAMLPLIMFALACGPVQGLAVGCAYGFLQLIEDPYVIHPIQLLCDYPLAFGVMILCCLANLIPEKARYLRLPAAVVLAYFARLAMATFSGVVFFAEYAGDQNVFTYSLLYNLNYLGWETLVAVVISLVPGVNRLPELIAKKA